MMINGITWDEIVQHFDQFIQWFSAQGPGMQVLVGIGVVLALILAGLIVYGAVWLAYQIVKFTIIATIILVYVIIICFKSFVLLFYDPGMAGHEWKKASANIGYFFKRCYQTKKNASVQKPVHEPYVPKRRNQARQVQVQVYFCPNCGKPFTGTMSNRLASNKYCFCVSCGQKFVGNLNTPVSVPQM